MLCEDDIVNYQKLKSVLKEGGFDIKGSAVIPVALLFKWYDDLGVRLQAILKKQEAQRQEAEVANTVVEPPKKKRKTK